MHFLKKLTRGPNSPANKKTKVMPCISQVGEESPEMLSGVTNPGRSWKSNFQSSGHSVFSYSLLGKSASIWHLVAYIFTHITSITFAAIL